MSLRGKQGIQVEERPHVSGDTDWKVIMKTSAAEDSKPADSPLADSVSTGPASLSI